MKMALCLYGQPRTFEFCEKSLHRHLIDVYSPDIFLATDNQEQQMREIYDPVAISVLSPEEELKQIGERAHRYGESVPNPGPYKDYPIIPVRDLSFLHKSFRCREMMRDYEAEHGNYDIVVTTRFDAKFLKIQPITKPNKNTYYIPRIDAFGKEAINGIHWGMGYCGHIWWADSITANFMLNAYNWSDDYFKDTGKWGGEGMTKYICDKMKINVAYTEVTFMLIRGTNELPLEGLPPWLPLSENTHPEYLKQEWEIKKQTPKKELVQEESAKEEPRHAGGFYW
jgi:hypothetical protein